MSYITAPEFARRTGLTRNLIYIKHKTTHSILKYMKKIGGKLYIDDIVFVLSDEKRMQENRCRDLFYELTKKITATELSRRVAAKSEKYPSVKSWIFFIHTRMWRQRDRFFDFLKKDMFDEFEKIAGEIEKKD